MRNVPFKGPRIRLDSQSYRELHQQVLQRDAWRCQGCGSMQQLQVHHLEFRSHSGSDVEQNLITLCVGCHDRVHHNLDLKSLASNFKERRKKQEL